MTADANPAITSGMVMTIPEVMEWLKLGRSALATQITEGGIPVSRIGGEYRFWRPLLLRQIFGKELRAEAGPDVITPAELAVTLRLTYETVRARLMDGSIPARRIGSTYRIWWPEVREYLETGQDFVPYRRTAKDQ